MKRLVFLALFITQGIFAQTTKVACSHVQLCNLIDEILGHGELSTLPLDFVGDPHHYEPEPKALRALILADYLIAGPNELHPWIQDIINKRGERPTFKLDLPQAIKTQYPQIQPEGLSHFWLVPELYCNYRQEIHAQLISWKFLSTDHQLSACPLTRLKLLEDRLKKSLSGLPIILSHDAMEAYLTGLGLKVYTLRGSGYHEQIGAQTLKELNDFLTKNPRVLWLLEEPIHIPTAVLRSKRTNDLELKINIAVKKGEQTLGQLYSLQYNLLKTVEASHE